MENPFKTIENALAHAEFKDPDIKTGVVKLIGALRTELAEVGYDEVDPGDEVTEATTELETTISNYESRQEQLTGGEVEDPFEGLGEDEE